MTAGRDAIVVGIDAYKGQRLHGCVNDAKEIAACLGLDQYGFDCKTLLDGQATRGSILEALGSLSYNMTGGEFLVFYFAGHGQVLGDHSHLVTIDGSEYDPGIPLSHLGQLMESASKHYRHVVAILDSCHSGGALTWVSGRPLQPRDVDREIPAVNESRCVMAACRPEETAKEFAGHGFFTSSLVSGLLGDAVDFDGNVTLLALSQFTLATVPSDLQTPVFKGDIAGTVVLGSGFSPRQGRPIDRQELVGILGKAKGIVDQHYLLQMREFADNDRKINSGARECAERLEPRLNWFSETEIAHPDLRRNDEWRSYRRRLRDYQAALADITIKQELTIGRVVRRLGHGGYGHVWEVAGGSESVALKVYHGNELDDSVKAQRFKNGYEAMRQLDHPRVVKVRQLLDAPFSIVMDYIPGDNLRESYIDRLDKEATLRFLIEIAETIRHAHGRDVKHRDIKPENIIVLYDEFGKPRPYLTDFDLAYHETNRTITTNIGVGGVINYAAPEQFYTPNAARAREVTVDVYAFAQLLFFTITGRDPKPDSFEENVSTLTRQVNDWVENRASERIVDLYKACSLRDPSERPQTIDAVLSALTAAESVVLAASGLDVIDEDQFLERLGHLYAGIGGHVSTPERTEMLSLSGQVQITGRVRGTAPTGTTEIEFELSVTGNLPLSHFTSGAAGRNALNNRLDRLLSRYPNATRHPGTRGAFQTFVYVRKVPLSLDGLSACSDIVRATVSAIESG